MTTLHLYVEKAELAEGATEVPVDVVLPSYLHAKMRNVKLHVKESRKFFEGLRG